MIRNLAFFLACIIASTLSAEPWKRHIIDDSSVGADGIRLADFNRDGRSDIVTGWEQGGVTKVYLQPAQADLQKRWPAVTVGKAPDVEDAVAVDLDGDGHLDVISSTEGKTRTLFVHWAPKHPDSILDPAGWRTEAFPSSVDKQAWMFCLPVDIDGKHGIDLIVGSKNHGAAVGWWQSPSNPRNLSDWKYHRLIDAGWIMSLLAHDVDEDGDMDVVLTDRRSATRGVKWLERPAPEHVLDANRWREHVIGGTDKESMFATLHDLDEDGGQDIVVTNWNGSTDLYQRDLDTAKPTWRIYSTPNPYGYQRGKSVVAADLNRDGRIDIAQTLRSQPIDAPAVVLMQHSGRPFQGEWAYSDVGGPDGSKFDLIEAVDVDRDGDLDLITCEEVANLGIFWYENPTFN